MYQFTGGYGSGYQQTQYPQQGGLSNGAQVQPHQYYGQSANYPQQYQTPHQNFQHPAQNYSHPSFETQNQAQTFHGYGNNQQHPPARNASYPGNPHFAKQHHGAYGPNSGFQVSQEDANFGSQSNSFSYGPERRISQSSTNRVMPHSPESCYNCGAPEHWAQDCPEPRRAVPAGQMNRPFKRQKTHGGLPAANLPVTQQAPPNPQRGWSHPARIQQSFPIHNHGQGSQVGMLNDQGTWTNQQHQKPPINSASSDGVHSNPWSQQLPQGPFTPQSAASSRQNSYHYPQKSDQLGGAEQQAQYGAPSNSHTEHTGNMQQPYSNPTNFSMTGASPQSATNDPSGNGASTAMAAPWSVQNLPTPAPSSASSHMPSPPTSDTNSRFDLHKQPSPRDTDSTAHALEPVASAQKKSQDPRTQQAELVAHLFSEVAQTPMTKPETSGKVAQAESDAKDLEEDEPDELYGLDFTDIRFEHVSTVSDPAILVERPLSSLRGDFDTEIKTPSSKTSNIQLPSSYLQNVNEDDFVKNIQETSEWSKLNDDPVFAKIKANTTTVTFQELIERRHQLIQSLNTAEDEDFSYSIDGQPEETDEERLSREQEERLAALGVTGSAKPVKVTPENVSPTSLTSPAETHSVRRISGDPGWKHYENGRPVEHGSASFGSSPSATREGGSHFSVHHQSPSDLTHRISKSISTNADRPDQHRHRKRTHSGTSEKNDNTPQHRDPEPVLRKQRFKQPVVDAAYSRRW